MARLWRFLSQLEREWGVCTWNSFANGAERVPFIVGAGMVYCTKKVIKPTQTILKNAQQKSITVNGARQMMRCKVSMENKRRARLTHGSPWMIHQWRERPIRQGEASMTCLWPIKRSWSPQKGKDSHVRGEIIGYTCVNEVSHWIMMRKMSS